MRVPNARNGRIERRKIVEYLLSTTHEAGLSKATVFARMGYFPNAWQRLAGDLLLHLQTHPAASAETGPHGTKFVVRGSLRGPTGASRMIASVWIIRHGETFPRFVTAYPSGFRGGFQ